MQNTNETYFSSCKRLVEEFIQKNGVKEVEDLIYYLPSSKTDFTHSSNGKKYDILNMGIYDVVGAENDTYDKVIQFLGVELDDEGEDTTNQFFFDFAELNTSVQYNIMKVIRGLYGAKSDDVARFIAEGDEVAENEEKVYYWQISKVGVNSNIESDNGFESASDAFADMRNELYSSFMTQTPIGINQKIQIYSDYIVYERNEEVLIFKVISKPKYANISMNIKIKATDVDTFKAWMINRMTCWCGSVPQYTLNEETIHMGKS